MLLTSKFVVAVNGSLLLSKAKVKKLLIEVYPNDLEFQYLWCTTLPGIDHHPLRSRGGWRGMFVVTRRSVPSLDTTHLGESHMLRSKISPWSHKLGKKDGVAFYLYCGASICNHKEKDMIILVVSRGGISLREDGLNLRATLPMYKAKHFCSKYLKKMEKNEIGLHLGLL